MKRKANKYQPTDAELLDWLNTTDCKVRRYNHLAQSELDDGDGGTAKWNIYNYRLCRGSNGATVREALTVAWRADTMPAPKRAVSVEKAKRMTLRNGVVLGEMDIVQLMRLKAWAMGRPKTATLLAACNALLDHMDKTRGAA